MKCLQLTVLWFLMTLVNAIKWYYFTVGASEQESSKHIALPWVSILADLLKPAFRHIAKNVDLHQEYQSVI